ncbi:MAG: hypothetical protein AB8B82_03315 [Roseovarius sp.]
MTYSMMTSVTLPAAYAAAVESAYHQDRIQRPQAAVQSPRRFSGVLTRLRHTLTARFARISNA